MQYHFDTTALLYVGIPFLTSLILIAIRDPAENTSLKRRYLNRLIDAFIIMLGSSVLLFEGFICVAMFMPIYLFVILIMFIIDTIRQRKKDRNRSQHGMHILPFLILLSAFEGVSTNLSFNRNESVTVSRVVQSNITEIKQNLIQPMDLQKSRPWFLQLFVMPDYIKAGSLAAGDVHEIHFKYYRWFFTNLNTGRMLLEISEVGADRIKTTFLEDSSYIGHYVKLKGTEIQLDQLDDHNTRVTLTIHFQRKLDPYWYFAPMERYAIRKTAEFLITEVIARDNK